MGMLWSLLHSPRSICASPGYSVPQNPAASPFLLSQGLFSVDLAVSIYFFPQFLSPPAVPTFRLSDQSQGCLCVFGCMLTTLQAYKELRERVYFWRLMERNLHCSKPCEHHSWTSSTNTNGRSYCGRSLASEVSSHSLLLFPLIPSFIMVSGSFKAQLSIAG